MFRASGVRTRDGGVGKNSPRINTELNVNK